MRWHVWLVIPLVLVACQSHRPSSGGGGGGGTLPSPGAGYNPENQPAVNPEGTAEPVVGGGRLGRDAGGPNAGAYGNTPPEGYRGSGSGYNRTIKAPATPSVGLSLP